MARGRSGRRRNQRIPDDAELHTIHHMFNVVRRRQGKTPLTMIEWGAWLKHQNQVPKNFWMRVKELGHNELHRGT